MAKGKTLRKAERTVCWLMPVLLLCGQLDLWHYGRSSGLAVPGWPGKQVQVPGEIAMRGGLSAA